MHVYTMGTRAYAEEVCAAIDPDGKIFGGRLLSRDESGSMPAFIPYFLFHLTCKHSKVLPRRAYNGYFHAIHLWLS